MGRESGCPFAGSVERSRTLFHKLSVSECLPGIQIYKAIIWLKVYVGFLCSYSWVRDPPSHLCRHSPPRGLTLPPEMSKLRSTGVCRSTHGGVGGHSGRGAGMVKSEVTLRLHNSDKGHWPSIQSSIIITEHHWQGFWAMFLHRQV